MSEESVKALVLHHIEKYEKARKKLKRSWDERLQDEFHRGVIHECREILNYINDLECQT